MNWEKIILTAIGSAGAIGLFFVLFRNGMLKGTNEAITLLQNEIKILRGELERQNKAHIENIKQISYLEGIVAEKDKKVKELMDIFTNRNPEFTKLVDTSEEAKIFMKQSAEEHRAMLDALQLMTTELKKLAYGPANNIGGAGGGEM